MKQPSVYLKMRVLGAIDTAQGRTRGQRSTALRHDRHRQDTSAVIVYHKGERMGAARLLDAVANGLRRRKEES